MLRTTLFAAAACIAMAGAARADVVYSFVPNSYAGGWSGFGFSFDLSDAAAHGGTFSLTQQQSPFTQTGNAGLDSLTGIAPFLVTSMGADKGVFTLAVTLNALGDIVSSGIRFADAAGGTEQASLGGTGRRADGTYSTDNPGSPCYTIGACTVKGHWTEHTTVTAVPEPGSLGLLGAGLLGFTMLWRRRRA